MEDFLRSTKLRQLKEADIEAKQLVLKRAWMSAPEEDRKHLDEMFEVLNKEWLFLRKNKEWMFNFVGGGWNTIMGADMEQAINNAKAEYESNPTQISLCVDEKTFRITNDESIRKMLSYTS